MGEDEPHLLLRRFKLFWAEYARVSQLHQPFQLVRRALRLEDGDDELRRSVGQFARCEVNLVRGRGRGRV